MRVSLFGLLLAVAAGALACVEHRARAAELEAERANAKRYAAAVAACANGDGFMIGARHVECRRVR